EPQLAFPALHLFNQAAVHVVQIRTVSQFAKVESVRIGRSESRDVQNARIDSGQRHERHLSLGLWGFDFHFDRGVRPDFLWRFERYSETTLGPIQRQKYQT